jgi:hypothetical protein
VNGLHGFALFLLAHRTRLNSLTEGIVWASSARFVERGNNAKRRVTTGVTPRDPPPIEPVRAPASTVLAGFMLDSPIVTVTILVL